MKPSYIRWIIVIFLLAFSVIFALYLNFNIKTIVVNYKGNVTEVKTTSDNIKRVLLQNGFVLNEFDQMMMEKAKNKINLTITKNYLINITDSNEKITFLAEEKTVGQLLQEKNIVLSENDIVNVPLDNKIENGMNIEITRIEYIEYTEKKSIPFNIWKRRVYFLAFRNSIPRGTKGKEGVIEVSYKSKYVNGELVETEEINRVTLSKPQTAVQYVAYSPSWYNYDISNLNIKTTSEYHTTAYSSDEGSVGTITAMGNATDFGIVAVSYRNPGNAKLGDWVYIESLDGGFDYGFAYVCDVGGSTDPNWMDLYFETAADMKAWGRRNVRVHVLNEKPSFLEEP